MKLKSTTVRSFDWYDVIRAFAEHTGMSFDTCGCWNLDYSKIAGEPNFRHHRVLQHEQDYLYPVEAYGIDKDAGDLQKILAESEKGDYNGKTYHSIDFSKVIRYLVAHGILPDDSFIVTNISF